MTARIPLWLVTLLTIAALVVLAPYAPWLCLAMWLGLYARRFYEPIKRRLGGREHLAATITVSLLLVVAVPITAVLTTIALDAVALVQRLLASEQTKQVLSSLVQNGNGGGANGNPTAADANPLESARGILDIVMSQGDRAWGIMRLLAGAAADVVIGLLIMVTGMYGVLTCGAGWHTWIEKHTPIHEEHFRRFRDTFLETGRGLWWGIVGAGLIQSIVATIAYVALGVPSALALGLLTLIFSVIPAIGTALVWAPVAAGLAITGQTSEAVILGVVGVFVIGTVDNVARPWLARRGHLSLPTWVVLVAMFGGIELFGAWGLLMGPLIVRLAKEALEIYREERAQSLLAPSGR